MHTLREFTEVEKQDTMNTDLKGVRTYWFGAHHLRGVPDMLVGDAEKNETEYQDWAWVPKRELNQYFTKENYECFIDVCRTR